MDGSRPGLQRREPLHQTGSVSGDGENRRDMPTQRLIFVHIPKAAGSTLRQIIRRQMPRGNDLTMYFIGIKPGRTRADGVVESSALEDIERLRHLTDDERAQIVCVLGHLPFGIHEFLPPGFEYITMLRNPVERIISDYYYILRRPTHRLYQAIQSRQISLEQYVTSGLDPRLDNGQVRYLCGMREVDGVFVDGALTERALEAAKRNLEERIKTFGITERFDESVLLFRRAMGWRNVFYESENVTRGRPKIAGLPSDVVKTMEEQLSYDMELYHFAANLFERRLRRARIGRFQLESFRSMNAALRLYTRFQKGGVSSAVDMVRERVTQFEERTSERQATAR